MNNNHYSCTYSQYSIFIIHYLIHPMFRIHPKIKHIFYPWNRIFSRFSRIYSFSVLISSILFVIYSLYVELTIFKPSPLPSFEIVFYRTYCVRLKNYTQIPRGRGGGKRKLFNYLQIEPIFLLFLLFQICFWLNTNYRAGGGAGGDLLLPNLTLSYHCIFKGTIFPFYFLYTFLKTTFLHSF